MFDNDNDGSDIVRFQIVTTRELKCKFKSIAPLYGHTITSLTNQLIKEYIVQHETKLKEVK